MNTNCRSRWGKIIMLVALGVAALGWLVMTLWNWLMPALFDGGKEINYAQAMGILLLSRILFGGFRGHGAHGRWHRYRWDQMTASERAKFQRGTRGCCGRPGQEDSDSKDEHPD